MKVTALIEDELIQDVMEISGAKNVTEALRIALRDYLSRKKLRELSDQMVAEPLVFAYGSDHLRDINRQ
ncbi:type II toxin-antitoxin system VapB family antitoxin [Algoriphagus sp. C2-6-M1]|uniref:type II toxin-antitoxin system VapB family antitoxin n=1 Tax=Algoriphagus persicinus TaxID=3108754 RepID=UPI002B3DAA16|nr:type II toxin-antitoxin system VapB family antitoxin [Algoriphagus sp. C2-6-M1]MEB2782736.1 type II toxin-antitoxin system VapB family antitoxin [Algoriphagus sp. C2-6-M1]